ncbi:hypothetical protein QAD02_011213 [Eretmocerus hayati]|uniref:Uncharacterized protein n=1 Tax=Eretmocerus hayati TaxID=131215 RepID=A0ACC2NWE6_9HYME|nr:hypothetical protein QAD02_011213 [Eretmocerus hayati]
MRAPFILSFPSLPELSSYGQGSLLVTRADSEGNYIIQEVDGNLKESFQYTYIKKHEKELMEIYSITQSAILILTCDDVAKGNLEVLQSRDCYMQILYKNSMITAPKKIANFDVSSGTEFYLSFVTGQYCFNAITYVGRGMIENFETNCVYDQYVEDNLIN